MNTNERDVVVIEIKPLWFIWKIIFIFKDEDKDKGKDKVLHDSQVSGGSTLRKVDHWMSEKLGGYRSVENGSRTEASWYGKYVEPSLHALEHTRRGFFNNNQAEYGRAKDAFSASGQGLHKKDTKYQTSYQEKKENDKKSENKPKK